MNVGLIPGKETQKLISFLESTFRNEISLSLLFPGEDFHEKDFDIVILEEDAAIHLCELEQFVPSPLIVVFGKGTERENLRYLPRFYEQFPALWKEAVPREHTLVITKGNQKFTYRQKDIVAITNEVSATILLRNGKTIIPKEGFRRMFSRLDPSLFFLVSQKEAVNILYVSKMETNAVLLENGLRIPFLPSQQQKVENAFYKTKFFQNTPSTRSKTRKNEKK